MKRQFFCVPRKVSSMLCHTWQPAGIHATQRSARTPRAWRRAVICCVLLVAGLVTACGFQAGGDEIGYVRDGQLWTIGADGSNATALLGGNVLGFAWSPNHHQIVVRTGNGAGQGAYGPGGAPDALSNLSVMSADGGGTVTITPSVAGLTRSDAWWDAGGNRLLYAEGFVNGAGQAGGTPFYILSQPDQPAGIARMVLQGGGDIPAMAPDGARVAAIDASGAVRVGRPGTSGTVVGTGALQTLASSNRPARLLWQPGRQALLYAVAHSDGQVALVLADLQGHTRTIAVASDLLDYAFAPDGSQVLIQTERSFEAWRVGAASGASGMTFSWTESDPLALAWWSPDGRKVLVRDAAGLWLADVGQRVVQHMLTTVAAAQGAPAAPAARWHPLTGSPFSADGSNAVFADAGTATWLGQALPTSRGAGGLYVAQLGGARNTPRLIATGAILSPSWSYLDPNSSWLVLA